MHRVSIFSDLYYKRKHIFFGLISHRPQPPITPHYAHQVPAIVRGWSVENGFRHIEFRWKDESGYEGYYVVMHGRCGDSVGLIVVNG